MVANIMNNTANINRLMSALILSFMLSACSGTTDINSDKEKTVETPTPSVPSTPTEPVPAEPEPEPEPSEPAPAEPTPPTSSTLNSITPGQQWKYFKGQQNPNADWKLASFDDSNWLSGNSGFGYNDNDDATILSDMSGNYSSVYTRKTFTHSSATTMTSMTLNIDYDDGFIAYLNGVEIARSATMPSGTVEFDTTATSTREAGVAVNYNLDAFIENLVDGTNVIAVEVHNQSIGSSDLSLITSLYFNEAAPSPPSNGGGGGSTPVTTSGSLSNYTDVSEINRISFISNDLSGITYNFDSDTYFMIQNNGGRIWEVNKNFELLRTITMSNSFDDTEDLVYLGNNELAIVNEASQLFIVNIFSDTTSLDTSDTANVQTITFGANGGNSGPEGVAFDLATQTFYIVKEQSPKAIYSFQRPGPGNQTIVPDIPFDATAVLTMATDLSAITFDPRGNGSLLILSHISHRVINTDISGNILGILNLADSTQHEGITLDDNFDLQVTSEANIQRTYAIAP